MEACKGDELEFVTHGAQFALEFGDGDIVQVLFPVKRWRAVIGQQFAGELFVNGFRKFFRVIQIRSRCLAPQQIRIRRISQPA